MQMAQILAPRLEMKLKMTTQMIQSIEMLQLPMMALEQTINQELINNPALEVDDDSDAGTPTETTMRERTDEIARRKEEVHAAELERLLADDAEEESRERYERGFSRRIQEEDGKLDAMQNTPAPGETLADQLIRQLDITEESPRLKELARYLIWNLDPNGYLRVPEQTEGPDAWRACFDGFGRDENGRVQPDVVHPTPQEMEDALFFVQSLEPAGVGARDVEECLIIQLKRTREDRSFEIKLVRHFFEDLCHNRLPRIAKETGATIEKIKESRDVIARLNPRPGTVYTGASPHYVIPDVVVEEAGGDFMVRMNDSRLPRLRVSNSYRQILADTQRGSRTRDFIREKIQSAKWLIDSIQQRRQTLQRIAGEIVKIQEEFLREGIAHLKPLKMQEVADRIGMHVSTVGRALTDKYIDTPQGVFPMKFFFTGGFEAADGTAESNKAIMNRIRQLVEREDRRNPLSDQEIVERMREQSIDIARRTVAKYREKLGIASSRQRKQY